MNNNDINKLLKIMAHLRDPENGCEWDKAQTFETIRQYTIEEAYEVAEAIDNKDMESLCDELGDLLLQVVFHSQIAEENNVFEFSDVVNAIIDKLVRRHPHIFNKSELMNEDFTQNSWENIKAKERDDKAYLKGKTASVLDDIPNAFPALTRSVKIQKRAANVGFEWEDIKPVVNKVVEELEELKFEIENGMKSDRILDESGDLLFSCVNLLRHLKIDPEAALRSTNIKFENRFRSVEKKLTEQGRKPSDLTLNELELLWNKEKCSI